MDLAGASVIITGSAGVMGRSMALSVARKGGRVVCADVDSNGADETVRLIESDGGAAIAVTTDVTNRAQVQQLVAKTIEAFGAVDALVNNAAIFRCIGGLWEVDPDEWWRDVTTNVLGPFLCCHEVLPHMMHQDKGVIINLSGGGFSGPVPGGTGYGSSKAALIRMTDTLAFELGGRDIGVKATGHKYNIYVYGMEPTFVDSEMNRYVARSPQGRRWLPFVGDSMDQGNTQPAEAVGDAVARLIEVAPPELSGRVFSYTEDLDALASRADTIKSQDLYQLRMRFK